MRFYLVYSIKVLLFAEAALQRYFNSGCNVAYSLIIYFTKHLIGIFTEYLYAAIFNDDEVYRRKKIEVRKI